MPSVRELGNGYTSQIDSVDERAWCQVLREFDDANIYQTWPYAEVISGRRNTSQLLLRKNGDLVAAAQVRIAKLPLLNAGIAYVGWGPLWRGPAGCRDVEIFRKAIRALRNEFCCKRALVLRLWPMIYDDEPEDLSAVLAEEGFALRQAQAPNRTILMSLQPPLDALREGMNPHWKRELKRSEKLGLQITEGTGDDLFVRFIEIYREMVSRKRFAEGTDINQFRLIQSGLPEDFKCKIMLCNSNAGLCAGLICSAIGKTAVYLFGATSSAGMKSNGSYLLQWRLIQTLKEKGHTTYNLNGINPLVNAGTYKFKRDLAGKHGKDVHFAGRFDSGGNMPSCWSVELGEKVRGLRNAFRARMINAQSKFRPGVANQTAGGRVC